MVVDHLKKFLTLPSTPPSFAKARRICAELAGSHYENFTLVSYLVPHKMRGHIVALYAFCRVVDDIGDEAPGDRLTLLDRFGEELRNTYRGSPRHPVMVALQKTIEQFNLPEELFCRLIEANRIDQQKTRYLTFDELLDYCDHSANPVGRLFLMMFGYENEKLFSLSDSTCTGLQLTNFWQDLRRDFDMERVYLPQQDMERFGVTEEDLSRNAANDSLRELLRFQVERARDYLASGLPLIDHVRGHLRVDIALFSRGGLAILDKIESARYDTLQMRPTLNKQEKIRLFVLTLFPWRWKRWIGN